MVAISIAFVILLGLVGGVRAITRSRDKALFEMTRLALENVGGNRLYADLLRADDFDKRGNTLCGGSVSGGDLSTVKSAEADEFFIHNPTRSGCDLTRANTSCKRVRSEE